MKFNEIKHAWDTKQVTPRRQQFLWTAEMTHLIDFKHIDPNTGIDAKYRFQRLTQAETDLEVRQNPKVLQYVLLDRGDECVRYNPALCKPGSPSYKDAVKGAISIAKSGRA